MSLEQIAKRLKYEFPGQFAYAQLGACVYTDGGINCTLRLTVGRREVDACSLDQAIDAMHKQLKADAAQAEVTV